MFRTIALTTCLSFLGACAAPDTYYSLSADGPPAASPPDPSSALVVSPVTLPAYIDRPELVFQSAPNIFEVPIDHRWTGRLSDNVTRVLASNLARRLPRTSVLTSPPPSTSPTTLAVEIHQFHSVSGGDATLHATATVTGSPSKTRTYSLTEPLSGDGYPALTAAQSNLLAKLAQAIATDLL